MEHFIFQIYVPSLDQSAFKEKRKITCIHRWVNRPCNEAFFYHYTCFENGAKDPCKNLDEYLMTKNCFTAGPISLCKHSSFAHFYFSLSLHGLSLRLQTWLINFQSKHLACHIFTHFFSLLADLEVNLLATIDTAWDLFHHSVPYCACSRSFVTRLSRSTKCHFFFFSIIISHFSHFRVVTWILVLRATRSVQRPPIILRPKRSSLVVFI